MDKKRDKHQPKFTRQMTMREFERSFPNEDACRLYLIAHRWPTGVTCPRCSKPDQVYTLAKPWHWECANPECRKGNAYRFSLIAGTIFENTKYPLRTWFWVLYLILTSKKGISALQIHRMIGSGSYSTAFYICHRLRASLSDPNFQKLMGIVEVDETGIGGKAHWRHKSAPKQRRGNWEDNGHRRDQPQGERSLSDDRTCRHKHDDQVRPQGGGQGKSRFGRDR